MIGGRVIIFTVINTIPPDVKASAIQVLSTATLAKKTDLEIEQWKSFGSLNVSFPLSYKNKCFKSESGKEEMRIDLNDNESIQIFQPVDVVGLSEGEITTFLNGVMKVVKRSSSKDLHEKRFCVRNLGVQGFTFQGDNGEYDRCGILTVDRRNVFFTMRSGTNQSDIGPTFRKILKSITVQNS